MNSTTIETQTQYPLVNYFTIEYKDKNNQGCNFIDTQWEDDRLVKSTIIFLN